MWYASIIMNFVFQTFIVLKNLVFWIKLLKFVDVKSKLVVVDVVVFLLRPHRVEFQLQ